MASKFANKIWNASRYILMNLEGRKSVENPPLLPADKWIYSRLNGAAKSMRDAFFSYRYNDAALCAYEFFWNDFCDWYVEATKLSIKGGDDAEKDRATAVLLDVLDQSLRLLHPLLPFITEEIYQKLPNKRGMLINSRYPEYDGKRNDQEEEKKFSSLQSLVGMARTLRSECGITPEKKLRAIVRAAREQEKIFTENQALIKLLAGIGDLRIEGASNEESPTDARPHGSIGMAGAGYEAFVFIAEAVDTQALKIKFSNGLERDRKYIETLRAKLANEQFVKNAPQELVNEQKVKLEETVVRTEKIANYLKDL
jgi:valyl-tRNA synthetase